MTITTNDKTKAVGFLKEKALPRIFSEIDGPPPVIMPHTFRDLALMTIQSSDKLLECAAKSPETIYMALKVAATHGLYVGGPMARAYLVPFYSGKRKRQECQLIVGFRGLKDVALRSGLIQAIRGDVIHDCDEFEYSDGLDLQLVHRPNIHRPLDASIVGAWAVARLRTGGTVARVMPIAEIDEIRDRHATKDRNGKIYGTWVDHYSRMARKTVFRALCGDLPQSIEPLMDIFAAEDGSSVPRVEIQPTAGVAAVRAAARIKEDDISFDVDPFPAVEEPVTDTETKSLTGLRKDS